MSKQVRFLLIIATVVTLLASGALYVFASGRQESEAVAAAAQLTETDEQYRYPIELSERQWRERLTDFEYYILREKGTERAFTGEYDRVYEPGIYYSRATGQPLFSSEHKYDSRTGWPSFWQPIDSDAVLYKEDNSLLMRRIEIVDSSSGSHLGHVFPDGPDPTGKRYCINSAALLFVPEGEEPPPLIAEYLERFGSQ